MTAINFPIDPDVGDTFLNFIWDGEKWRNAGSRASAVVLKDLFEFSVAADDSTLRTVSTGESLKFTGAGTVTTSSDAEGNITITGVGTTSYNDLTDKPTIPSLTGYATETFVTTRGYLTTVGTINYNDLSNKPTLVTSYTQLTDKPNLAGTYTFNVAADDSTLRTIGSEETIKFVGAGTVTTSSDAEGNITITGPTSTSQLTNNSNYIANLTNTFLELSTYVADLRAPDSISIQANAASWTFRQDSKLQFPDSTFQTTAYTGNAATVTNGVYTTDTGTVTNTMLAGSIANSKLANSAVTVNGTSISLGASATVTAAAGTLTGDTLNSTVVTSSLTSLGTLSGLTVGGTGGDLTMTGGAITGVGNITAAGILAVNASGGITTTQTSFDIVNSTATTVNLGGAATAVNIGATTGTLTLNNPTVVGTQTTQAVFDTIATTVTAFRAASAVTIGATSGTLTLRNTTIVGTQTSLTLFNTVATTVNAFGAATTLNIGYTGTTGSNTTNILTAAQQTGTTKTVNIGTGSAVGSTTAVNIGSTSGTSTVTVNGTLVGSATSQDVFNTTATTVNFAGAATTLNLGGSTGNTTVNNNLRVTGNINTGTNSFAKSPGAGDIAMDNNSTDTPGLLMYYADNSNFGIDSWNGSFDVLSGQLFRVTNKLNETGGAVKMAIDTSGNAVFTGFVQANAWRAGQVIKETVLGHTDVTQTQQGGVNRFATDSYNREFIRYAYTPSSSSSYIVVTIHLAKYTAYGGTGNDSWFSQMQVGATSGYSRNANGEPQGLSEVAYSLVSTVNGNRTGTLFPLMGRYTNGDTNSKTISIAVRRESADDYWDYDWSSSSFCMRITEIAR